MLPTYHNLQLTVLDKRNDTWEQGDVVAFRCDSLNAVLVKRIVACPGDSVYIYGGTLYVNGEISRVYGDVFTFEFAGLLREPVTLDEDEYIVIGDNIAQSKDSRYPEVGVVRADSIIGRVM